MNAIGMTALALVGAAALASPAMAQERNITDATGGYQAGINVNGTLYNSTGIGLQNPAGQDYIRPGTPRDSWGITGSTGSAYADPYQSGTSGIASTVSTATANTATFTSSLSNGLQVTGAYNFFAPNILSIQQTVTNTTASSITDVVFRRNVDLDIPPSTFNENVFGVLGSNSAVVANSYYGFENPNPAVGYSYPCGTTCNVTGDYGAGIDLGLGTLTAGQSVTFAYYYGINQPGQKLDALFAQAQGLGLNYLIGAQSTEAGSYPALGAGSGFLGVSSLGTIAGGVPEPSTWALMILGFGAVGGSMRSRRRSTKVAFAV